MSSDSEAKLYVYGVWQFVSNHDDVWSNKIFLLSYQIKPTLESLYHYIRGCLVLNNISFEEIVHFFAYSKKIINQKENTKINLIWFLLAYICADLSLDDIKERKVANFGCADINYSADNPLITKLVNQFYNYDFISYFENKSKIYSHNGNCSSFYELLLVLVGLCQEKKKELRSDLLEFVKNKDYSKLVQVLEMISDSRRLTNEEECLLSVGREFVRLSDFSSQPRCLSAPFKLLRGDNRIFSFGLLKKIIGENDFVSAYDVCERLCNGNNVDKESNLLYLMLRDLNGVIESKKSFSEDVGFDKSTLEICALEVKSSGKSFEEFSQFKSFSLEDRMLIRLFLANEYYQDALELYYLSKDMNGYPVAIAWQCKYFEEAKRLYGEVARELEGVKDNYPLVVELSNRLALMASAVENKVSVKARVKV